MNSNLEPHQPRSSRASFVVLAFAMMFTFTGASRASAQSFQERMWFPAVENVAAELVNRINAETQRIDISIWYLTEHSVTAAIANQFAAGVPVRLIGDRGAIFEIDPNTKAEFYYLANLGVPIRLRFNPTWFPEIDHMKMAIFKGQGIVEFGSANWDTYSIIPFSSTNYNDETVLFTNDPVLVGAFLTRFDRVWNDTTPEPESIYGGPPYLKDWMDACTNEPTGCDFLSVYPNPAPMIIDTTRLEPDNPTPPDLIWGQGPDFNSRLVTEINNENTSIMFADYRLTVDDVTSALLAKQLAGVPVQMIIEPGQYLNRTWPEFWLSHANFDKLWAAGVQIKQRNHDGNMHMKTLITSTYATNASSNIASGWERDNNYFVSAATKPSLYTAIQNRFNTMWNDSAGFVPFQPGPPDATNLDSPVNASAVPVNASLVWDRAAFATGYDVYMGFSSSPLTKVANVPAQMVNNPPTQYSWTPGAPLCTGTTYYWMIVSLTNATPVNPSLSAGSTITAFTTDGPNQGCSGLPGTNPVPAPWSSQDVGSTGLAGSASYASGVFTVAGAGADIWGTADAFQYVSQPTNGDTQIVARVTSLQNTDTAAKAGVMLRQSTAPGDPDVILDIRPDGTIEFMSRSSSGGATTYLAGGATQPVPAWLELTSSGNTVTGSVSSDGATWSLVGSVTTPLSASATIGLAVTSHNTGVLNTSTFDNVSVTGGPPPPPLPAPWSGQDVGSTGLAGSASYASGQFTIAGAGADIWGTADAFQYVSQPTNGDAEIVARVTSLQNTDTEAKAGVMLRQSTDPGAADVILDIRPDGTIEFMSRSSSGQDATYLAGGATQPVPSWLELASSGNTVTGSVSSDGATWSVVGSVTTPLSASATIGLAVTSHNTAVLNTSTFDNVSVTGPPAAPNIVISASDAATRFGS